MARALGDIPAQDRKLKVGREDVGGRFVSKYDPKMALEIVERIALGETLSKICSPGSGFVHPSTFKRWAVNHPDLAKAYKAAREMSAESLEEEALDRARETAQKPGTPQHVSAQRLAIEQLRWSAERRDPAKYGNRGPVQIRVPIQINTTLDMGGPSGGFQEKQDIYTLSARVSRNPDDTAAQAPSTSDDKPLVQGAKPSTKRKVQLIPPGGPRPHVPWTQQARGIVDAQVTDVRQESDQGSNEAREGRAGNADERPVRTEERHAQAGTDEKERGPNAADA